MDTSQMKWFLCGLCRGEVSVALSRGRKYWRRAANAWLCTIRSSMQTQKLHWAPGPM